MIWNIPPAVSGILLTLSLTLCFAELFCLIAFFVQHRSAFYTAFSGILLFFGYTLFQLQESIVNKDRAEPYPTGAGLVPVRSPLCALCTDSMGDPFDLPEGKR